MITDGSIIKEAREIAINIIKDDPNLQQPKHKLLREIFSVQYADQLNTVILS